jgi:crotonobetaine/carnitine-CoA ligase
VESVIRTFPGVAEVAVIGVRADERGGEDEVKACIVLREGATLDPDALIDWCDARMGAHMIPRYVEIMDSLPQTPSEKVKKKDLRERGITPQTWDRQRAGRTDRKAAHHA